MPPLLDTSEGIQQEKNALLLVFITVDQLVLFASALPCRLCTFLTIRTASVVEQFYVGVEIAPLKLLTTIKIVHGMIKMSKSSTKSVQHDIITFNDDPRSESGYI